MRNYEEIFVCLDQTMRSLDLVIMSLCEIQNEGHRHLEFISGGYF